MGKENEGAVRFRIQQVRGAERDYSEGTTHANAAGGFQRGDICVVGCKVNGIMGEAGNSQLKTTGLNGSKSAKL